MGSTELGTSQKLHAVCVPLPAQGHVNPMMQLAKLLHSRGFHITFVNTEFNHRRLIRSRGSDAVKGLPDFQFETIPDGLPPSDKDATQDPASLSDSIRKTCLGPFKELVIKLNSSSEVPQVTCIVSDGVMGFGREVAKELGILGVQFWTASACGFMAYLHYTELVKRGIVPFKDENFMHDGTLDQPIDWISCMKNIRLKDMPSFIRVTDVNDIMFDVLGSEAQNCLKSSAIIFNTFDEFEHEVGNFWGAPGVHALPIRNDHFAPYCLSYFLSVFSLPPAQPPFLTHCVRRASLDLVPFKRHQPQQGKKTGRRTQPKRSRPQPFCVEAVHSAGNTRIFTSSVLSTPATSRPQNGLFRLLYIPRSFS